MKFTKIRLNGLATVDLPIVGALPSDTYILKAADGLGPPEVDVHIAKTLYQDGVYQGRRPQGREITLRVGLNPNYGLAQSPGDLRNTLYGLLTPGNGDAISVHIMDGNTVVAITTGYVKRIEIVPFTKEPEVQISIPCLSSYLMAPAAVNVAAPANRAAFNIQNAGSASAGFRFEATATAALNSFLLTHTPTGKKMSITAPIQIGDKIIIDTRPGSRQVNFTRGGTLYALIGALSADSNWPELLGGLNPFTVNTTSYTWTLFTYTPRYWGI